MKTFFIFLFLTFNINLCYAQDSLIYDINSVDYNTSSMYFVDRDLDSFPIFCSCDCSTMVKSSKIFQDQADDELYLFGGYYTAPPLNMNCQKIVLNVSACNGQSISSLSIEFPQSNDDCFTSNFYLYDEDNNGNQGYLMNFDPDGGTGVLTISPPIAPCTSRKVIFYICSTRMSDCEHDTYSVNISVNGQNPSCDIDMSWHFDFYEGIPEYNIDINLREFIQKNFRIHKKCVYRIVDIYQQTILTGRIKNFNELLEIKHSNKLSRGLYIIQLYDDNKIIYQEKFIK